MSSPNASRIALGRIINLHLIPRHANARTAIASSIRQQTTTMATSFYDLETKNAKFETLKFNELKGKVVLVVNVASQCGYTKQYSGLQELYKKYKDQGFTILGFPCN